MTLISLEDAKAEVRKVVSDFKTRYDINYRLNSLPSIELEEDRKTEPKETFTATTSPCIVKAEQTEPQDWKDEMWKEVVEQTEPQITAKCLNCANSGSYKCTKCDGEMYFKRLEPKDEPQTEREGE